VAVEVLGALPELEDPDPARVEQVGAERVLEAPGLGQRCADRIPTTLEEGLALVRLHIDGSGYHQHHGSPFFVAATRPRSCPTVLGQDPGRLVGGRAAWGSGGRQYAAGTPGRGD